MFIHRSRGWVLFIVLIYRLMPSAQSVAERMLSLSTHPSIHSCMYPPAYPLIFPSGQLLTHLMQFSVSSSVHLLLSIHLQSVHPSITNPCMYSSMHTSVYVCIFCPSVHLCPPTSQPSRYTSIHLCTYLCIRLDVYLHTIHPPADACIHPLVYLYIINPSIHISICLSIHSSFLPLMYPSIIPPSLQPANHALIFCSEFGLVGRRSFV